MAGGGMRRENKLRGELCPPGGLRKVHNTTRNRGTTRVSELDESIVRMIV